MSRDTAIEMMILAAGWGFAVMTQSLLNTLIASYISQHWITDGYIANQSPGWAGFYTSLRDQLSVGMLIGLLLGFGIYRFAKSRIEIECAIYVSSIVAVFWGVFLYVTGNGIAGWGYLIFFIECAPLSAVFWKGVYTWGDWVNKRNNVEANKTEVLRNEVKVVRADPKPITPAKTVIDETKELKKEDKPVEKKPVPPQESPAEQKSLWRID